MTRKRPTRKARKQGEFQVPQLEYGDTQTLSVLRARRREADPARLTEVLVPRIEALLRSVAVWGTVGEDWSVGDYRYLILSFVSGDAGLYVQFWSEPHDLLLAEVSSGNWNPPAQLLFGAAERRKLRSLGYRMGGPARNYQKEIPVSDAALAALAAEAAHILVNVLAYRGLTVLRAEVHAETAGRLAIVHDAVSPDHVAQLLTVLSLDVSKNVGSADEPRMTALAPTGEDIVVRLLDRVGRSNAFRRVVLLREQDQGAAFAPLDIEGGVTTQFLHKHLAAAVTALLDEPESVTS